VSISKKPKSKPAAKKKAAAAPHPDRQLIVGIAAGIDELARELKAVNRKLDYCVGRLGPSEWSDERTRQEFASITREAKL
jgi:hypothetical protein